MMASGQPLFLRVKISRFRCSFIIHFFIANKCQNAFAVTYDKKTYYEMLEVSCSEIRRIWA